MDWSKAKNIIIAALLVANLLIGGSLLMDVRGETQRLEQDAADCRAFLEHQGIAVETEIPPEGQRLPVLFVRMGGSGGQAPADSYRGYPIAVAGGSADFTITGSGEQSALTITAAEALLKLYADLSAEGGSLRGQAVEELELVYLLTVDSSSRAAQDTAIPAWRVRLSGQDYYVGAYAE
jgi:hypothetical protein